MKKVLHNNFWNIDYTVFARKHGLAKAVKLTRKSYYQNMSVGHLTNMFRGIDLDGDDYGEYLQRAIIDSTLQARPVFYHS